MSAAVDVLVIVVGEAPLRSVILRLVRTCASRLAERSSRRRVWEEGWGGRLGCARALDIYHGGRCIEGGTIVGGSGSDVNVHDFCTHGWAPS